MLDMIFGERKKRQILGKRFNLHKAMGGNTEFDRAKYLYKWKTSSAINKSIALLYKLLWFTCLLFS
jgi:hypothetical protein